MAAVVTFVRKWDPATGGTPRPGADKAVEFTVTGDDAYPEGGYILDPADVGLKFFRKVDIVESPDGFICKYVPSTGALMYQAVAATATGTLDPITITAALTDGAVVDDEVADLEVLGEADDADVDVTVEGALADSEAESAAVEDAVCRVVAFGR